MSGKVVFNPAYWGGKKLAYPNVSPEGPKFAASVVAGNLIFVSGCQGQNDETVRVETDVFEDQMIIALDKVRRCMEEAKRRDDYPAMRRTEFEYYQKYAPSLVEDPPASTVMIVELGRPEYLIEIEVVGVVSRD